MYIEFTHIHTKTTWKSTFENLSDLLDHLEELIEDEEYVYDSGLCENKYYSEVEIHIGGEVLIGETFEDALIEVLEFAGGSI